MDGFLNTITGGSNELVRYLQKAVGSSLSGDISEQALFVLYGTGANGKSTFLNTISELLEIIQEILRPKPLWQKG